MRCGRASKILIDYIEDGLDERTRSGIEAHLQECPNCKEELGLLRSILGELRGIEDEDPGEPFWENLRESTYRRYRESLASQDDDKVPFLERLGIRPMPAIAWATAGALSFIAVAFLVDFIQQDPGVTIADLDEDAIIEAAQETDDLDTYLNTLPGDDIDMLASLTVDVDAPEGTVGEILADETELALLDGLESTELTALLELLEERYPAPQERDEIHKSSQADRRRHA